MMLGKLLTENKMYALGEQYIQTETASLRTSSQTSPSARHPQSLMHDRTSSDGHLHNHVATPKVGTLWQERIGIAITSGQPKILELHRTLSLSMSA